jgi:hypothetical protein
MFCFFLQQNFFFQLPNFRGAGQAIAQIPNPHKSSINDPLPIFHITCQQFAALTGSSERSGSLYSNLKETVLSMQTVAPRYQEWAKGRGEYFKRGEEGSQEMRIKGLIADP